MATHLRSTISAGAISCPPPRGSREAVWVREGSRSLDQPKVSPTRDVSLVLSVGHLYNICHLALIRF